MQVGVASSKQVKQADGSVKLGVHEWEVPNMLSKCKEGSDRNRIQCMVMDFVVHPDTCRMALNNARFKVLKPLHSKLLVFGKAPELPALWHKLLRLRSYFVLCTFDCWCLIRLRGCQHPCTRC